LNQSHYIAVSQWQTITYILHSLLILKHSSLKYAQIFQKNIMYDTDDT